jgi:hypothetical protein
MNSTLKKILEWLRVSFSFWFVVHGVMFLFIWAFLTIFTYHGVNSPSTMLKLAGIITLCSLITSTPAYFVSSFQELKKYNDPANSYLFLGLFSGIVALIISAFLKQPHPQDLVVGITAFATGVSIIITIIDFVQLSTNGRRRVVT